MTDGDVMATWSPAEGQFVVVRRSAECRAYHGSGDGLYGRVEVVDRAWDDPRAWLAAALADGMDPREMLAEAAYARGHYYYVSDALDTGRYVMVDEHCCALELEPADEATARPAIATP